MSSIDQTSKSFKDKWEQNKALAFSETLNEASDIFNWILNRNGFFNTDTFKDWLSSKKSILDAGCGNGRVTALLDRYSNQDTKIIGCDLTSSRVASENLAGLPKVNIRKKDLLADLKDLGKFDLIYCQEVLHHTSDPRKAFLNLCSLLNGSGEIAIYVYKKKAPLREYADDSVREKISVLSYDEAILLMNEVTEFGKALTGLGNVKVPEVKVLGIDAGEYDIQRLIYHFFCKCFWNPSMSFEDNAAINYDWYHPQLCTRHTLEEVESWYQQAELKIIHRCVDHYGITIRGIRSN